MRFLVFPTAEYNGNIQPKLRNCATINWMKGGGGGGLGNG